MPCLRLALLVVAALLSAAAPAAADVVDDNVSIVSRQSGDAVLFARAADGALHMRQGIDGTWVSLGVPITSGPSATVRPDGSIEVYARGPDSRLGHVTVRGSSASPWKALPELGTVSSGPAAGVRRGTDELDLSARGDDGNLYVCSRSGNGPFAMPCTRFGAIVGAPATASRRPDFLDVYVRGTDDNLYAYYRENRSTAWQGPLSIDQRITAAPGLFTFPSNSSLSIFVRNAGRGFSQRFFADPGGGFDTWREIDPRPIDSAVAGVDAQTATYAVARSGSDVLVKTFQGAWGPWRSIGPVAPPPAPQPPAPAPAPVGGGQVSFEAGLSCTPRGGKVRVSIDVRKRGDRRKPRVTRVVFFYKRGKRARVVRSDRKAPYARELPVALRPGTYRVYARIEYKRGRKKGRKTVSRRFAVCA